MELVASLLKYKDRWPTQDKVVDEFISLVKNNPKCFHRESLEKHVTASAFVLNLAGDSVLLTHHRKLNKWLQLGGHCDGDSDVLGVAIKEAQEESGIKDFNVLLDGEILDVGIRDVPQNKDVPFHLHYDVVYLLQVVSSEDFVVSEESIALKWVNLKEMKDYSPNVMTLRDKVLAIQK